MILFVCVFNIPMKKSKGNFGSVSHVAEGLDDRVSIKLWECEHLHRTGYHQNFLIMEFFSF